MDQRAPQFNGESDTKRGGESFATEKHRHLSAQPVAKDSRPLSRVVVLALLWLVGTVVGVLVLLQLFVVERIPTLDEARLEAAEELWKKNGPASYDMDIEIGGAQPGTVHVEVRGGRAVAMTRDGRSPPERTWEVWTVPGQFETLERELEIAEDPVHEMQEGASTRLELRCEFDARYGYPRRYQRVVYGGGPQVNWHVTSFEAR